VFALVPKGSITGQLQRALAAKDVLAVRSLAGELPDVPLQTAAEITLLLRERERKSYAPAARRLWPACDGASDAVTSAGRGCRDPGRMEGDPAMSPAGKLISLVQGAPPT